MTTTEERAELRRVKDKLRNHIERCREEIAMAEQMLAQARELEAAQS